MHADPADRRRGWAQRLDHRGGPCGGARRADPGADSCGRQRNARYLAAAGEPRLGAAAPRGAPRAVVRRRRAGGQRRKFHDRGSPVIKQTVRAASEADGLVTEMRQLAQAVVPGQTVDDPAYMERTISTRIATFLMVLLVTIIFATSALPDVGPTLAKVIQAHL